MLGGVSLLLYFFGVLLVSFVVLGDETQGLANAKQALCHRAVFTPPSSSLITTIKAASTNTFFLLAEQLR